MKLFRTLLLTLTAATCFTACSDSPETLGKSTAKKLFKKEIARLHQDKGAATVQLGYYECNDNDDRLKLRQLAANDIVTYKCDVVKKNVRVKKTRRVQAGYYYRYWTTESYWVDELADTYFVTVALTKKGEGLKMEEQEAEPDENTKELKLDKEIDLSKYPESKVQAEEFPAAQNAGQSAEDAADEADETAEAEETSSTPETAQADTRSAYEKAKDKENTELVQLKAFELSVVKARNVRKLDDYTGQAEVLMEYENVTPVGRIMLNVYDGQRFATGTLHYTYYEDRGWRLDQTSSE